jgi:uncharacterized protein involved in exopolysaccharide biosynthesis
MTAQISGHQGVEPSGYFVVMPPPAEKSQIDVREILAKVWRGKYILVGVALLFGVSAYLHARFVATPIYRSSAVISVRQDENGGGVGIGGQLSGLASLAGVNLRGGSSARAEFLAKLQSRELGEAFINRYNLLPVFFANLRTPDGKAWQNPEGAPSIGDGFGALTGVRQINENLENGLITVSFQWKDRFLAQKWAAGYIEMANDLLRASALREAQGNLDYLAEQAKSVENESLRLSVFRLTEMNLNRVMLAKAQPDFAFKTIDAATVSDANRFVSPVRRMQALTGLLAGFLLALIYVLWRREPQKRVD